MDINFNFILIFLVYGLAFFSMGLATLLEAGRSPLLAEARVLRPLAAFGIFHGIHEWLEMVLILGSGIQVGISEAFVYLRLGLLVISFLSLIAYGVQVFRPPDRLAAHDIYAGGAMLAIYLLSLLAIGAIPQVHGEGWSLGADIMARYILAVPGALLATLALGQQSQQAKVEGRIKLASTFNWASIGMGLYGITQLFGPPADLLLAESINAKIFANFLGFPVQLLRTLLAIIITVSIIRATQIVEKERQQAFVLAQLERVEALEQVQEEMSKRNELRKQMLRRTVILQEEERIRISRELHDETAQSLTAFSANLAALNNQLPAEYKNHELVSCLHSLTRQMASGLSRMVHDLRPAQLDELGLPAALKFLHHRVKDTIGLEVNLNIKNECKRLDPLVETVLYRIAQEALTNVARHAEVNTVNLTLMQPGNEIHLVIEDKGIGFEAQDEKWTTKGVGLVGMRERVEAVGGKIHISSAPGGGTQVLAIVPLEEPCAED